MALAKEEREMAARGEGRLGKAADDEPVFVLRGQDILAAELVDLWADMANLNGCGEEKVQDARELAAKMRAWEPRKYPS